jgi:phage terminase large subunit-like protein
LADVLAGRVVACKWVKLACERQDRDQKRAATDSTCPFVWSDWHARDVCDFVEKLPHIEGTWKSATITLEPWQIFILTTIFGWRQRDHPEWRRFNTVYIEVARKNAKSVLTSAAALYGLTCEGEVGPQIRCFANTGDQARIIFNVCRQMVLKTPDLREAFSLDALANSIVCYKNNGNLIPINAKASTQDGLNPHWSIGDELHAQKERGMFDVMKSARGARKNPMSWYITTAGFNLLGVCYEQRTFVNKVLEQVWEAEHYFGIIYTLDEGDDPYDEAVWPKPNPNIGVSVQLREMRGYAAEAKVSPDSEGEFKTKRCNLWLNASGAWLNMGQWERCGDDTLTINQFAGEPCWIGGDLAQLDDIAAIAAVFERDDIVYAFTRFYLPRLVVEERARKVPAYQRWVDDGLLIITEGTMIDYARIEADIRAWCETFSVRAIRMDEYGSVQIVGQLFNDGLPAEVLRKNAKNFTPAARALETRVRHQRFRHDGNQCLKWMASNCVVRRGVDDSVLPKKEHPDSPNKIDGIDAILEGVAPLLETLSESQPSADDLVMAL